MDQNEPLFKYTSSEISFAEFVVSGIAFEEFRLFTIESEIKRAEAVELFDA